MESPLPQSAIYCGVLDVERRRVKGATNDAVIWHGAVNGQVRVAAGGQVKVSVPR